MNQDTQYENNQNESSSSLSIVITGASGGIGRATALHLATSGHRLFLCARNQGRLDQVISEIRASGGEAHGTTCDVSSADDVKHFVSFVQEKTASIDVLFNNAGCGHALEISATTNQLWNETLGVNLTGTFHCCREFLPLLQKATTALIINNASIAARQGFPGFTAYAAAKGGVVAFSNALREELRSYGIRVSVLVPGATSTGFWDNLAGEWDHTKMMTASSIASIIARVIEFPAAGSIEEIRIMPSGGAL